MAGLTLDQNEWAVDWENEYGRLMSLLQFDCEGWPRWTSTQERVCENEIDSLPPLLQLEVRARFLLGDVPVHEVSPGKLKDQVHISLDVQKDNHLKMCLWQARLGITAGFAMVLAR